VIRIVIRLCSCGGVACWGAGFCLLPGNGGGSGEQGVHGWFGLYEGVEDGIWKNSVMVIEMVLSSIFCMNVESLDCI
jgi:hypothetical protein